MEESEVLQFLLGSGAEPSEVRNVLFPQLERKGFRKKADLKDMEDKDLEIEGLSELSQRRISKLVNGLEMHTLLTVKEISVRDLKKIKVRYIPCTTGLFSENIQERVIDRVQMKPKMESMSDLVSLIKKDLNIPDDQVIELYTGQGYPMHLNHITAKATLEMWGVSDCELFYVMSHKKDQPGQKRFATLRKLDHDIGQESFTVEMPCQRDLKVNAYIGVDSPEDIGQKIYSLTGVSVPYMSLFIRRGYLYERLSSCSELEDKDVIRVALRNPNELVNPRSVNFGSSSYNPLISHSKQGLSKFYSILKFLRSPRPLNADYDFEKLLSFILHVTNFPPLVYALRVLREQSFLTIAEWTALVEGLFALFKTVMSTFTTVSDENIFEYSDYLWSVLIKESQTITDQSNVACEKVSLLCAISRTRILKPVLIPNLGYCDESHVMSYKNASIDFTKVQYNSGDKMNRLLLCFPWESDKEVYRWINAPEPAVTNMVLGKIDLSTKLKLKEKFALKELSESLEQLHILNPQGLFGGKECLTYIDEGRLVYFMGFAKGTDEQRRIYDPCHKEYIVLYKTTELDNIGKSGIENKVSNDLTTVWKTDTEEEKKKQILSIRKEAIVKPHHSLQWEPEEAIVVLLDRSGSMCSGIFGINNLRRIDAAKELFSAFVTRTQAYQLHHCLGFTTFDSSVDIELQITKNPEEFQMALNLERIQPRGSTSLTDAIINGVDQLKHCQCKRRILCLTDGSNTSYKPYSDVIQEVMNHNVIVDTVLLTGPGGNTEQKALSHASGGVCVLPLNMSEALMFFEMDTMLSLCERPKSPIANSNLSVFKDLATYPYETKDDFKVQTINTESTMALDSYMKTLASTSSEHQKRRIINELKEFTKENHDDMRVFPSQENYNKWVVVLRGPKTTAYEGGAFVLSVYFTDKYPGEPPQIRFLTPIYHCNISGTSGRICHAALSTSYTPSMSMREILCHIYGLMMCPDMDTPIDGTLADQYGYFRYHNDHLPKKFFGEADKYFDEAKKWVKTNATKSFEELCKEFEGTP